MRLGAVWQTIEVRGGWQPSPNAYYRAIDPMRALERRGHEVVWPGNARSLPELDRLLGCDIVHVYRSGTDSVRRVLAELAARGTAITYDNDDDFTAVPKQSPLYKQSGGLKGQRIFAETVKAARLAHAFTTPSEALGEKYRRAGIERVEVIGNSVTSLVRRRGHHEGVVIGWVAGGEHRAELDSVDIVTVLRRLLAKHPQVRVECIGVNLALPGRYRNDRWVALPELPARMTGFDIGIAPLADIPYNRTRSNIKVKEYAAAGVPWLASPIGPYQGLGEDQGGRLVPDDGWFEALDQLASRRRDRRRLARKARAWAKRQTIDAMAGRWEQLFAEVAQ